MTESEIESLEDIRWSALTSADVAVLDALLAEDLVFVHSSGRVDSKQSLIEAVSSGSTRYVEADRTGQQIRVFGDTALVHGNASVRVRAGAGERERSMRYLAVWHAGPSGPRMIAWQAGPLPTTA
jgi:ketosteroid isomerase-like protein